MTQELTYTDYKQTVESQTQAMLRLLTVARQGELPQNVSIPDGIPSLNELGLALSHLLGDMQTLLAEKAQTQAELEERVADRTRALEIALDEMQALQRRYLKNEWLEYAEEELDLAPELAQTSQITESDGWPSLLTQAVQTQQPVYADEANQPSHLALPISYSGQLIGLLGFQRETNQTWSEDELTAAGAVVEQVGLALENQRLFDQTQTALQETQFLYELAIKLNTANTLDDILQIIIEPAIQQGAHAARLFVYELAEDGKPRWDECVAVWDKDGISKMKVGTRVFLPDLPNLVGYFADGSQPTLINNIATDPDLDNGLRQALLQSNDQAIAMLPLKLAGRWVGTVSVNWPQPHVFSAVERRLYKTLMLQTAIVVNNRLLFEQAQERAEQLEIIARVEAALSQATHEDEIILALLPSMKAHLPHLITLDYLQRDETSGVETWQSVAWWYNGVMQTDMTFVNQFVPIKQALLTQAGQTPDQLMLVETVEKQTFLTPAQIKEAQQLGFHAAAMLPLLSGARWQGVVSFIWSQPHNFLAGEKFIFRRLMESLGAVVASRRAYLATEATRYETEHLYYSSRRIN
jgi:GAF domain-containing protein